MPFSHTWWQTKILDKRSSVSSACGSSNLQYNETCGVCLKQVSEETMCFWKLEISLTESVGSPLASSPTCAGFQICSESTDCCLGFQKKKKVLLCSFSVMEIQTVHWQFTFTCKSNKLMLCCI